MLSLLKVLYIYNSISSCFATTLRSYSRKKYSSIIQISKQRWLPWPGGHHIQINLSYQYSNIFEPFLFCTFEIVLETNQRHCFKFEAKKKLETSFASYSLFFAPFFHPAHIENHPPTPNITGPGWKECTLRFGLSQCLIKYSPRIDFLRFFESTCEVHHVECEKKKKKKYENSGRDAQEANATEKKIRLQKAKELK